MRQPGALCLKLEFQQLSETHTEGKMHWRKFTPEIHYVPEHIKIVSFVSKLLNDRRNCSSFAKPPISFLAPHSTQN